jgi:protein-S-isoprenylcysteine O-methyltransferase Ste14
VEEAGTMAESAGTERPTDTSSEYASARRRVERKRKFVGDLVAYLVVNAFLVGIWAVDGFGYFWPGWVLAGWGVLLVLDAWNVYGRRPITDADVEKELRNGH